MRPTELDAICQAVGGEHVAGSGGCGTISAVTHDTRTAGAGELFVAIAGRRFDGHAFLPAAAEAGCAAAMVARGAELPEGMAGRFGGGLVVVDDTVAALGRLAAWHRRRHDAAVVAVTGSNGKTTVKMMIHHILARSMRGTCGPKSFNNAVGVPLTLLAAGEGDRYVVCEIGTNAPGEVAALAEMASPDVAVITSIGPTHLAGLGGIAGVAAEKASIVNHLPPDGLAVVPADSDELTEALSGYGGNRVRFGTVDGVEFRLTGYEFFAGGGQRFEVNGRFWVPLPLPGRHNAVNALAAMAVANHFGVAPAEAGEALGDFTAPAMRLERLDAGDVTVINDAYNANPASVLAAADVLAEQGGRRKVMVVGDMRELGAEADAMHGVVGGKLAARGVDLLVCVGELGRYIALGAAGGGLETVAYETVEQASASDGLVGLLRAGDVVLLKGSRAMGMERLVAPIRAAFARPTEG